LEVVLAGTGRSRLARAGGTILAGKLALRDGSPAISPAASTTPTPIHGEGFCALNDVASPSAAATRQALQKSIV